MIARYFAIDTEKAPLAAPITKSNYRFRLVTNTGTVSVFQITPRRKRKGMIAGELWIDNQTGLVTHLTGRLVKSPSVMLRKSAFLKRWRSGTARRWPARLICRSTLRFTGRAELTIRERARGAEAEVVKNVAP